jgi:hypothetical protein
MEVFKSWGSPSVGLGFQHSDSRAEVTMKIRCAVINGDLTAKLRECKAQSEEPIPENVARFLEELQRVAA